MLNSWNPEEHQGKREDQVAFSNGMSALCGLILAGALLVALIAPLL